MTVVRIAALNDGWKLERSCRSTKKPVDTVRVTCDFIDTSASIRMPRSRTTTDKLILEGNMEGKKIAGRPRRMLLDWIIDKQTASGIIKM